MNVKKKKKASAASSEAQPLMQHVLALRRMLLISLGAAAAGFLGAFYFLRGYIMDFISSPIEAKGITLIYTAVSEALITQLKVSLVAGIVLASPVIVWQIWSFVKPALYEHEQKAFRRWFFVALILFLMGIVFCYLSVYPMAMNFFLVQSSAACQLSDGLFAALRPYLPAARGHLPDHPDRPDHGGDAHLQAQVRDPGGGGHRPPF